MKICHIFEARRTWDKVSQDPRLAKQLGFFLRLDTTIPPNYRAKLDAPRISDQEKAKLFGELIDNTFNDTKWGNLSEDGKFDNWILNQYITGRVNYEDISSELVDALGSWKALSIRNMLDPAHQDLNNFKKLQSLQTVLRSDVYSTKLRQIKIQAEVDKQKREQKSITLIDDENFLVIIPVNYGACYVFNNSIGVIATFCTGSSSGARWFENYSANGPMISVLDKNNPNNINGKWQIHAPSNQLRNANQTNSSWGAGETFGKLFPGLMNKIVASMRQNAQQIHDQSKEIVGNREGYNVEEQINLLKRTFPDAFTSEKSVDIT
jgi:hypothetical protein